MVGGAGIWKSGMDDDASSEEMPFVTPLSASTRRRLPPASGSFGSLILEVFRAAVTLLAPNVLRGRVGRATGLTLDPCPGPTKVTRLLTLALDELGIEVCELLPAANWNGAEGG